jgi:transcriptional regulator with XRE-family HTH domain
MQAPTINFQIHPYNAAMPGGRPSNKPAPKFGQRLAALRGERGLSQSALAAQLGTTRNAILHYERSAKNPSADFIEKVAAFFGVGFDDLLGSESKAPRKPGPTPQIAQLTERLSKLPRAQQKVVVKMLEGVLKQTG